MIYILVWLLGGLVAAIYSAARAHVRAEEAYQLAWACMQGHHHVADVLAEHHSRLEVFEGTAQEIVDSYGGTDSE